MVTWSLSNRNWICCKADIFYPVIIFFRQLTVSLRTNPIHISCQQKHVCSDDRKFVSNSSIKTLTVKCYYSGRQIKELRSFVGKGDHCWALISLSKISQQHVYFPIYQKICFCRICLKHLTVCHMKLETETYILSVAVQCEGFRVVGTLHLVPPLFFDQCILKWNIWLEPSPPSILGWIPPFKWLDPPHTTSVLILLTGSEQQIYFRKKKIFVLHVLFTTKWIY